MQRSFVISPATSPPPCPDQCGRVAAPRPSSATSNQNRKSIRGATDATNSRDPRAKISRAPANQPTIDELDGLVFAITTIATYVVLCVYSTAGLQRFSFGPLERYGEVLSGTFIALVGVAFWLWPVL